jgi:hypothetical protein
MYCSQAGIIEMRKKSALGSQWPKMAVFVAHRLPN